ncbi:RNA ligase family protein [Hymenobacter koreensis]|uniref:RNA ligase domain-containing protein n=1 Tax=Hymenobacter koreensis TaxID=1084523 RepID=A0ABP8JJV0_9BACT
MGYLHIDNLYKNQVILLFKECYALEKIHGTSAHISWRHATQRVGFFAGGESHERFIGLFDAEALAAKFNEVFPFADVIVYGEAFGGKQQGMSRTYGPNLCFSVFDVKVGDVWLAVPSAADVAEKLGITFVAYERVSTDLAALNAERDRDSTAAQRNGMGGGHKREGVVLRPLVEATLNNGSRIISKHKRDEFMETKTPREVSPEAAAILAGAQAIADEWVTPMRLLHVLDKLPQGIGIESTPQVINAMLEDVLREAKGEIVESKAAAKAIGAKAAQVFKQYLQAQLA